MMTCPQCKGSGYTVFVHEDTTPDGLTFTAPTQTPAQICSQCLGSKFFNGSST